MFLVQKTDQKLVEQATRIMLRMLRGLKEASGDPAQAALAEKYQARMQRLGTELYGIHVRVQVGCSHGLLDGICLCNSCHTMPTAVDASLQIGYAIPPIRYRLILLCKVYISFKYPAMRCAHNLNEFLPPYTISFSTLFFRILDIELCEMLGHWGGMQEMVAEGLCWSAVEMYAYLQCAWQQGLQEHVPPSSRQFNIATELEKLQASYLS
jgi:hypothetical protein